MSDLIPLIPGVPLLAAGLLATAGPFTGRRVAEAASILTAAAVAVLALLVAAHVSTGLDVYWFGGWRLRAGIPIGIDFAVDPLGACLAGFVGVLMTLALLFTWRYFDADAPWFQVLMLVFLAGMVGFALSGDLFNLFVFFELMSVSAFALVGYRIDQRAALEGSLNFAVVNTLGSFLLLIGIGLIYAKTGTLNLAQMGRELDHQQLDGTVIASFGLLAGAMSEIGLFGVGRVYFTAYEGAFAGQHATLQAILVGFGLLTALLGGAMALAQDHLKRLLAFAVISFIGVFLTGLGLLTQEGVAGTAVYVLADGFVKASLFACVGIIQHRLGHVSERRLRGAGRRLPVTGAVFALGGLMIAALPPFGPFLGKSMIEDAMVREGFGFVPPLIVLSAILTGAAILRAAGCVFLGWGPAEHHEQEAADAETHAEAREGTDRTPAVMFVPAVLLLAGGMAIGVWFGFADLASRAAARFADHSAYVRDVLGPAGASAVPRPSSAAPRWFDWLYGSGSALGAVALAAFLLHVHRLRAAWPRAIHRAAVAAMVPVERLHSGRIGDYTAWLLVGAGAFGGLFTLTMR
jgi:multicomponent Na+:H+ antiporter subunit D